MIKQGLKFTKMIWLNWIAFFLITAQIFITFFWSKKYLDVNLIYIITINILITLLINYNYYWLGKNDKEKQELYYKNAGITYHALKFTCGFLTTIILAIIMSFCDVSWIKDNAYNIMVMWVFVPLIMVFLSSAILESRIKDEKNIPDKVKKIPDIFLQMFLTFAEFDDKGKLIWNRGFIKSSFCLSAVILAIVLYYYSRYLG